MLKTKVKIKKKTNKQTYKTQNKKKKKTDKIVKICSSLKVCVQVQE